MSFVQEKHYITLRAIERGIIYGIIPGDMDGDGFDELLILGERYAHLLKIYDLGAKHVEMRQYIPDPANIEIYVPKGGAVVDLDGDKKNEIALAIYLGTGTSVWIGFKDMRMNQKVNAPFKINGMASGDIDGDGIPEFLLYGDSEGADFDVLVVKGGKEIGKFLIGLEIFAAAIGDVDGDGINEIVLSFSESHEGDVRYYLGIFRYSGGKLEELYRIQTSREVMKMRVEDLNGDGKAEIYVMSTAKVSVLAYDGQRIKKERDTLESNEPVIDFISSDFDGDGYVEILVATKSKLILYEHGIPEATIEEEIKNRGFTCVTLANIKGSRYLIAGLDGGLRIAKIS